MGATTVGSEGPRPDRSGAGPAGRHRVGRRRAWLLASVAVVAPVGVALVLVPWRGRLTPADDALVLVVVIVAVATAGYRWAAALCALVASVALDIVLTRPYGSFRIDRAGDLVTAVLLLVVGLAVGDMAARGRAQRAAADRGRSQLTVLHAVTELAATGRAPDEVVRAAARELTGLLTLRSCLFTRDAPATAARVEPDGRVRIGTVDWETGELGLPYRGAVLPVRGGGHVLGAFVLDPVLGVAVPREQLQVAVALADQAGAALAVGEARLTG
jgi:K+-sensing histidine kinase KdpD